MTALISFLRVIHITNAILMAWPFYALVVVNQRARLGPPLGDRTDTFMENLIKSRAFPCFIFQITALASGLVLLLLQGMGLSALVTNQAVAGKSLLLLLIAGLLSFVHFRLQPRIDALFLELDSSPGRADVAQKIVVLRLFRKRMASICLFSVLMMAMLGVQVYTVFPFWLNTSLIVAIAGFTWRAYRTLTPYGWV